MREDCGFGKAKEMPRVGIGSVPDLVDNGNAFKTMDALRKQEKELRGKIDTMEVGKIIDNNKIACGRLFIHSFIHSFIHPSFAAD